MSFPLNQFVEKARDAGHSEEYIILTSQYINELNRRNLPVIFDDFHLAVEISLDFKQLKFIINNSSFKYTYFFLRKRDGTRSREIMSPEEDLKQIQQWINKNILQKIQLHSSCSGFLKGGSILRNANPHANAQQILKIDLLRFFDTITSQRVYGIFKSIGYTKKVAYTLTLLTTSNHRKCYWERIEKEGLTELGELCLIKPKVLPQGAPTSPMLANIVATNLDKRLFKLAEINGYNYTRYADDLTFSSKDNKPFPISLIIEIITSEGFYVNKKKVRICKRGVKQYVTGLTITNGANISKKYRRELMTHLYFAKKYGPINHLYTWAKKHNKKPNVTAFQDWLLGRISFVSSINKKAGNKFFNMYNSIDWVSMYKEQEFKYPIR